MKRIVDYNNNILQGPCHPSEEKNKKSKHFTDVGISNGGLCNEQDEYKYSCALACMIGKTSSSSSSSSSFTSAASSSPVLDDFFHETYQKKPAIYHVDQKKDKGNCHALDMVYSMGWKGVCDMLHKSQTNLELYTRDERGSSESSSIESHMLPLFFRNQEPLQLDDIQRTYGNSPFAAYLDGCSIVNNHADLLSAPLAALCLDIQKSLPHVYVNTYLTPPKAAAVTAHADDRDVFVIQVLGEKQWKVYSEVPIPYPSAKEQVGKNGLPIPESVLQNKLMYNIMLKPGDVLYMPRGFVHEAATSTLEPSFHCTVAIATHDWSLATVISSMVAKELNQHTKFRMAIHPQFGMKNVDCIDTKLVDELSRQIVDAMDCITSRITLENVSHVLENKFQYHNDHVQAKREALIQEYVNTSYNMEVSEDCSIPAFLVGPKAACHVTMDSTIRASTPEERALAPEPVTTHGRGLMVREEICDEMLSMLDILKKEKKVVKVEHLRKYLMDNKCWKENGMICDLSILSFVKCCVELGALSLIR